MSQKKSIISNFKVKSFAPQLSPEQQKIAGHLLPKTVPNQVSFNLDATVEFANCLRMVIFSHIKGKCLTFEMSDVITSSQYILEDAKIAIMNIPLDQSVPGHVTFTLRAKNPTPKFKVITSGDIKASDGKSYFNDNIELFFIEAAKEITIKGIRVIEGRGKDHASFCPAHKCISVVLDEKPYDCATGQGVKSAVSRAKKFKISFQTNGNVNPKKIITQAASEINLKLDKLMHKVKSFSANNRLKTIVIPNEDNALGGLFTYYFNNNYKATLTHDYNHLSDELIIRLNTNEYIYELFASATEHYTRLTKLLVINN